jgi:hypothetical protein
MMIILKSKNFWIVVGLSLVYWLFAPVMSRSYVFDIANAFSIAGAIGVIVMYYPSVAKKLGTWLWIFKNDLEGVHYFIIGVMGLLFYTASRHVYNLTWRWMGKPEWMIDHLFVGYMIWFVAMVCLMHLLSRDMERGEIPRENWRWVGIFVTLGIALAGLFITVMDPSPGVPGLFDARN